MPARFPDTAVGRDARTQMNGSDRWNKDDDIVISGISGRLPESDSIEEFKQNLMAGIDMVTEDDRRFPSGIYGIPKRSGKIKNLQYFDATFFGVSAKQAECMEPQMRLLLELTQEAIMDAGINPVEIRRSRTGVFIGISYCESVDYWSRNAESCNGYGLLGGAQAMVANRISFSFDFTGPSYVMDTACSSSLFALHHAQMAILNGQCDAAIVAGSNVILKPLLTLQFQRFGMLSKEGKCKAFDASGTGYVRSESCVVIFLQKSSDARRVYATLVNSKTNTDGNKEEGITYPSSYMQTKLLREFYSELNLDPLEVSYVEAHGTGTKAGDPVESKSIAEVFCKNRKSPLLIGSVKSNMGHSEPASGVCAIAKVIISMESGIIPRNLHFQNPNPDISALIDGRFKVCTENTPFGGGYVAINSFGFGGANAHVLLKSNPKPKASPSIPSIPRLLTVSGRTQSAVTNLLKQVEENSDDDEFLALIYAIHKRNVAGHKYRGYSVLGEQVAREISEAPADKRPIWFVYSGMGSQYTGMAKQMMKIDVFKAAIDKCSYVLKPHGINLEEILLHAEDSVFEDILNSFVAIAAAQIALTDCLTALGIQPDGILGHSVGELGCAYADGAFTAEQMILAAYARGRSILESNLPDGAMAAVGLSWEECHRRCPPEIIPACHNSANSVTLSGPVESINNFVKQLESENIFAKAVRSAGKAFHSKYIMDAGPMLRKALDAIIPNPKPRSPRWISTSIPESAWHTQLAQSSSAAYHVNNLLSPVLFNEGLQHIPDNAIVIEIAPHSLLQAILKHALKPNCSYVPLMKRGHENNLNFFLSNIGKLYNVGGQPDVMALYPPVSFPVGRGTKMISPMIEWDHSVEWTVPSFVGKSDRSGESIIEIDLRKEEHEFIAGHTIDGRVLFPATGYMTLVWKAFAKLHNKDYEQLPVVLEDVNFLRATIMPKEGPVKFLINIFEGSGEFELSEGDTVTVSGRIRIAEDVSKETLNLPAPQQEQDSGLLNLTQEDVYCELRLRGYDYYGMFQGIHESDNHGIRGKLDWNRNWISFLDTMLQFSILGQSSRLLYLPIRIEKTVINPTKHLEMMNSLKDGEHVPVYMYRNTNILKSGGIEIRGLKANTAPRRHHHSTPKLEKYVFIPNDNKQPLNEDFEKAKVYSLTAILQLLLENSSNAIKVKVAEIAGNRAVDSLLVQDIFDILNVQPMISADCTTFTTAPVEAYANLSDNGIKVVKKDFATNKADQTFHMIVGHDLLKNNSLEILRNSAAFLLDGGMLLLEESMSSFDASILQNIGLVVVNKQLVGNKMYLVVRKMKEIPHNNVVINITENNYKWVKPLRDALKNSETDKTTIYVVAEQENVNGLIGLVTCLSKEAGGENVRSVFIQDKAEKFSLASAFYKAQLRKDLVSNVLKNGVWGTFRHLLLDQQNYSAKLQVEHAYVNTLTRGDLSSLRWIEGPLGYCKSTNPKQQLCSVYYAPLNFRDIMLATGKLPADALPGKLATEECVMGLEFSGRDSTGRRVMALTEARSLATNALAPLDFMWEVPDKWSLEEAASVPAAYATSYYALIYRGQMRPGESILIHAGSGGVGQAAIAIALHMGCTVFTTVGTPAKRAFIKERFPQITDDHIGNSRDTSFEQLILEQTQGQGVDLVLNSLAEDKLQASIRCLAKHGRFLEIGKVDLSNNSPLGMGVFLKNVTFHGILLDCLFNAENEASRAVSRLVSEGIQNGAIRPLPTTVFSDNQIEEAFRYMATGKHIGKVMLKIRDEESQSVTKPPLKLIPALPRTYFYPEKTYVLVGGLGGFGLELTDWFVQRGARKIVLNSRSGIRTGYQSLCMRRWRNDGVTVEVLTDDVTTESGAKRLLEKASRLGTVGGIFNLAAVLRDALMENQTEADFLTVCRPKVDTTKSLDVVSRKLCPHLDYFVTFSSVSCGRGNIGQTNYGYANSVMERICEERQAAGLPGLAIQWGAIGDVGLLQRMTGGAATDVGGTVPQKIQSCMETMDLFMQQPHPVLASMVLADSTKGSAVESQVSIVEAIAHILGMKDHKAVPLDVGLADLGMDSIMGSEIKQTLERNYDIVLSAQEIRSISLAKIIKLSGGADAPVQKAASETKTEVQFMWPEIMPSKPIIQMKSKSNASQKGALFVVHPVDGVVSSLEGLTANLQLPVYGLQCTADAPLDSISALAGFYIKQVRSVQPSGPYTICGYSFGACVAFEMALQLESKGERVKLVLVDGSPHYLSTHTSKKKDTKGNRAADESEALTFFILQFKGVDQGALISELSNLKDWDARLTRTIEILKDVVPFPVEQLKMAASSFFFRLVAGDKYNPTSKFRGEVMLLRAQNTYIQLEEDYGLNSICKQTVRIQTLDGDHRSILTGDVARTITDVLQTVATAV